MLARLPPPIRWALGRGKRGAAAAARKAASRAGSLSVNVTFIRDRASAPTEFLYSRDPSMAVYSIAALAWLRRPISATPPAVFSHWKTNPAMYQAKVGGVFNID